LGIGTAEQGEYLGVTLAERIGPAEQQAGAES
jgi:hypothetical protein